MKILFTGKGNSGANEIRANQVASGLRALGVDAVAIPKASVEQCRAADVIVLVKRPTAELLDTIRASGKPFAWDVVDSWTQPIGNEWPKAQALAWLHDSIANVKPDLLICSTRAMLEDAEYVNACVIYHHARPEYVELRKQEVMYRYAMLGYEGGEHYLGRYDIQLQHQCIKRKWQYNFDSISGAHVAICLRDTIGYAPRHWKSNVKLANAQALGIPALCSPESGYRETSTGGVLWIESPEDLPAAFDQLANPARYAELCAAADAPPTLESVSRQYLRELGRIA